MNPMPHLSMKIPQQAMRRQIVVPLFFLLLAFASTWPLLGALSSHLPMGMEDAATVPLFNVWTIWWNADRAAAGYEHYWDAPIFNPAENTFAFSEPMPLTVLAAPIIWTTGNRILAYNCLLFLSLCLNGWMTFLLLRRFHFHWISAWIGGAMMELLPLIHSWLGVLQLIPVFGIVWSFLALYQFGRRPAMGRGIVLGLALAVSYLICAYYGLFLFVLLLLSGGWLLGGRIRQWKMWRALLPGIFVTAMLCLPVIRGQHRALSENSLSYPEEYLAELSADVSDYLASPWPQMIHIDAVKLAGRYAGFRLCPGMIKLALMMIGIAWGLLSWRRRNWTLFCLTMLVTSFLLSLGPRLQICGWKPYMQLVEFVPGFAQVRNVFRFAVFVQVAVSLLAAMGLQAAVLLTRRYIRRVMLRRTLRCLIFAAGIMALTEILPPSQPLYAVPSYHLNHAWIEYLKKQTPADSIVVCIPFPFKPDVLSYEQETIWMYWGTFHQRRMVNGYSGYFPKSFVSLKMVMTGFPMPESIDLLCKIGVTHCVVKRNSVYGQEIRQYHPFDQRIEAVFSDNQALTDIYHLKTEQSGIP